LVGVISAINPFDTHYGEITLTPLIQNTPIANMGIVNDVVDGVRLPTINSNPINASPLMLLEGGGVGAVEQTPWTSDIDAANFSLNHVDDITADTVLVTNDTTKQKGTPGYVGMQMECDTIDSYLTVTSQKFHIGEDASAPAQLTEIDFEFAGTAVAQILPDGTFTGKVVIDSGDITAAGGVLESRQILAGPGMAGGGDLSADRTLTADVTSVLGRIGDVELTTADITNAGAALSSTKIVAGSGLSGGGDLAGDVALSADVTTVFGRTGDVVLTPSDVSDAGGVPNSRQVNTGAGLAGGGPLSADLTLTANVQSVFSRTGAVVLAPGDVAGVGGVLNTRKVSAGTGLTGGGSLAADITLSAAVTTVLGRIGDVALQATDISTAGGVLTSRQIGTASGSGLTGGGSLSADLTLAADVLTVFGRKGSVVLTPSDVTGATGVLNTRKVLTGAGMSGGGDLTVDRTLAADVQTVFGRIGAVLLTPNDIANATGVLNNRSIHTGAGLAGGGNLTNDLTLTAAVTTVCGRVGDVVLTNADMPFVWQQWTPSYSGMTVGTATLAVADWIRIGPTVSFAFSVSISFSGTMANAFTISPPLAYSGADAVVLAFGLSQAGTTLTGRANISSAGINVFIGSGNFASGQTYVVRVSGTYRWQ
jgi:hypothetical protein